MKIHIIGGSGSGKSYLSERLSKELLIPHYDLDDLQWDNTADSYGAKMPAEKRARLLENILLEENWIIEGVYYKWCKQCFEEADQIYLLEIPRRVTTYRILKRFLKRKIGIEKGKKESLKSIFDLVKWTKHFQTHNLVEIKKLLSQYEDKVTIVKSKNSIPLNTN